MKKFNSTLAIAAIALTSVLGFTSCDKSDDPISQIPTPQVQQQVQQTQPQGQAEQNQTVENDPYDGFLGTWHGTDSNGTAYTLDLQTVEHGNTEIWTHGGKEYKTNIIYKGSLTVDGKTYSGYCRKGIFVTDEKGADDIVLYCVNFNIHYDKHTANSFHALTRTQGKTIDQDVTFTK